MILNKRVIKFFITVSLFILTLVIFSFAREYIYLPLQLRFVLILASWAVIYDIVYK